MKYFSILDLTRLTRFDEAFANNVLTVDFIYEPSKTESEIIITHPDTKNKITGFAPDRFYNFVNFCRMYLTPTLTDELITAVMDEFDENTTISSEAFEQWLWHYLPIYFPINEHVKYSLKKNIFCLGNHHIKNNRLINIFCQNLKNYILYPQMWNIIKKLYGVRFDNWDNNLNFIQFAQKSLLTEDLRLVTYVEVDSAKYLLDSDNTPTIYKLSETPEDDIVVIPNMAVHSNEYFVNRKAITNGGHSVYKVLVEFEDVLDAWNPDTLIVKKARILEESWFHKKQILCYNKGARDIQEFSSASVLPQAKEPYLAPHPSYWGVS